MPGPSLIGDYLAVLSADLPERIVSELADGLEETYRHYLGQGLAQDAAARAAIAEFGEPRVIVTAFTDASGGRNIARRLRASCSGPCSSRSSDCWPSPPWAGTTDRYAAQQPRAAWAPRFWTRRWSALSWSPLLPMCGPPAWLPLSAHTAPASPCGMSVAL